MTAYDDLNQHIAEYNDLLNIINLLKWDMRTCMPSGGSATRGQQLATLSRMAKDHFTSDKTARLLDSAESEIASEDADSYRVRIVRQTREYYEIVNRIPSELLGKVATLQPTSEHVWEHAKKNADYATFKPYLQQMLDLKREIADYIGYEDHPFDALVFEFEPSMTAAKLKALFDDLKSGLLPLLNKIMDNDKSLPKDLWSMRYPVEQQRAFSLAMAKRIGYDLTRGRLDIAPHPFEISFTRNDVRIATRYDDHFMPMALFGTLHEAGHALYEQAVDPSLTRTALTTDFLGQYAVGGTSYGVHEFSSRLWENVIGHSRAFWEVNFAELQTYFPEQLNGVDVDLFYRAVNRVKPSLIHVDADEVTYNLHIMLRVEIELGMLDGRINLDDLPDVWNAKMQEYLGVTPPDDGVGVLQDVHWSGGGFGSFPGYTVGNVLSGQFMEAAHAQDPNIQTALNNGDYAPLREWLTDNIYRHGRAYSSTELLQRVTGRDLTTAPYLTYLNDKFTDLYDL
ncbi:MAG: carboxypeptidase M32 [Aggregatilineales bacterium]